MAEGKIEALRKRVLESVGNQFEGKKAEIVSEETAQVPSSKASIHRFIVRGAEEPNGPHATVVLDAAGKPVDLAKLSLAEGRDLFAPSAARGRAAEGDARQAGHDQSQGQRHSPQRVRLPGEDRGHDPGARHRREGRRLFPGRQHRQHGTGDRQREGGGERHPGYPAGDGPRHPVRRRQLQGFHRSGRLSESAGDHRQSGRRDQCDQRVVGPCICWRRYSRGRTVRSASGQERRRMAPGIGEVHRLVRRRPEPRADLRGGLGRARQHHPGNGDRRPHVGDHASPARRHRGPGHLGQHAAPAWTPPAREGTPAARAPASPARPPPSPRPPVARSPSGSTRRRSRTRSSTR